MAEISAEQAYMHLHKQLQVQRNTLRRRGVAESIIDVEIKNLRNAVSAELWSALLNPVKSGSNSP
jgi:hypothetical protein